MSDPRRIMISFWGRRGALSQFALEMARASQASPCIDATFSLSRQNEAFPEFEAQNIRMAPIDTFATNIGMVTGLWRIPAIRRNLQTCVKRHRIEAIIELMPHVWSPLLVPAIKAGGARYCPIVHDAIAHPGDGTAKAKPLTDLALRYADRVLTLSDHVSNSLVGTGRVDPSLIRTLFHPDLNYASTAVRHRPAKGRPFRVIFLGRIMPYKGLPLFVDAVEQLRAQGIMIEAGVYGEGSLGTETSRLEALGAHVINRWLSGEEIGAVLAGAHVVVLSHIEASQSGVAAAAFGAGLPVVATPIGGIVEQVRDGETGILAREVSGQALAEALARLITEPRLYERMLAQVGASMQQRSMTQFVAAAADAALS